ncbi:hypothetical protein QQZ08_005706 [Neonectria magnoliae]|uniref:Uncharacterized protein n=1 Tax=Neonectria magnoliae TaxID=2732573 RepID=A0ABR1I2M0_9HYPO
MESEFYFQRFVQFQFTPRRTNRKYWDNDLKLNNDVDKILRGRETNDRNLVGSRAMENRVLLETRDRSASANFDHDRGHVDFDLLQRQQGLLEKWYAEDKWKGPDNSFTRTKYWFHRSPLCASCMSIPVVAWICRLNGNTEEGERDTGRGSCILCHELEAQYESDANKDRPIPTPRLAVYMPHLP